ncbi:hypothetical protein [Acuticoccus sp. I52.16.1]|uniref:hypothetical protein n=1 Tax=Acuticoccus sp. I52.16.1 TaxID=2928472 RepID=UPI001FD3321B|nr:hypothetical protein [Acuticoccus sp. I52.16.1]UOM35656.1 hypothetical protein MRB58_05470 [Acuticoccus sp. I52.16.1]
MARLLLMLACVVSGGTALAQYDAQQNRQILQDQRRDAQSVQQQQSYERQLQSYELRDRAIRNSQRQVDTFRPTDRPGIGVNGTTTLR